MEWLKENSKKVIGVGVILILILVVKLISDHQKALENEERVRSSLIEDTKVSENPDDSKLGLDQDILDSQKELEQRYGKTPDGFIWDTDGSLIPIGDAKKSSEDSLYTYLRALSTLDMGVAERFSYKTSVVNSYHDFFDASNKTSDYKEDFKRKTYRAVLQSLQVLSVSEGSTFAKSKVVFTVKAKIIDLSDKSFWVKDKDKIFKALYDMGTNEQDKTKSDIYIYDYIVQHYNSDDAKLKEVTFDVTLEKYPMWGSGWLVSKDADLDALLKYTDGNQVINQIQEEYTNYASSQRSGR